MSIIRSLWRQAAELGHATPLAHLTLDLDDCTPEQLDLLEQQARRWIERAQAARPRPAFVMPLEDLPADLGLKTD